MKFIQKIQLPFALASLLIGWLSPIYASKLCGEELNLFLKNSPFVAASMSQASWVFLMALPLMGFVTPRCTTRWQKAATNFAQAPAQKCTGKRVKTLSLLLVPVSLFVIWIHSAWYASFSGTNAATNTILWNTDIVTTPVIALLLTGQRVTWTVALGGLLGLMGTGLTVHGSIEGDTLIGCGLCFLASLSYATYAVFVERVMDRKATPVTHLLGYEGFIAMLVVFIIVAIAIVLAPDMYAMQLQALPSLQWLAFLGTMSLFLNIGWLWCTEIAGAFWTAMVACLSMPLAMVLDIMFFEKVPGLPTCAGAALIVVGFAVASITVDPEEHITHGDQLQLGSQWIGGEWPQQHKVPLLQVEQTPPGTAAAAAAESAAVVAAKV